MKVIRRRNLMCAQFLTLLDDILGKRRLILGRESPSFPLRAALMVTFNLGLLFLGLANLVSIINNYIAMLSCFVAFCCFSLHFLVSDSLLTLLESHVNNCRFVICESNFLLIRKQASIFFLSLTLVFRQACPHLYYSTVTCYLPPNTGSG